MKKIIVFGLIAILIFFFASSAASSSPIMVQEILANCEGNSVRGEVKIKNNTQETVTGQLKLFLTYHRPNTGEWLPTDSYTFVEYTIEANSDQTYEFFISYDQGINLEANSIRIENDNDPIKSESFGPCRPPTAVGMIDIETGPSFWDKVAYHLTIPIGILFLMLVGATIYSFLPTVVYIFKNFFRK